MSEVENTGELGRENRLVMNREQRSEEERTGE